MIPNDHAPYPAMLAIATTATMIGGGVHWQESGTRLLTSSDGGWTWDVAWLPDEATLMDSQAYGWDGRLVGPVIPEEGAVDEPERWYLVVNDHVTLEIGPLGGLPDDDGGDINAWPYHLPAHPDAVPIAPVGSGRLLCFDNKSHEVFEMETAAFELGSR